MKTNNIIEKIILYDTCCICYEIPTNNYLTSCCYSLFCQICNKKINQICPLCKNNFSTILFPDVNYINNIEKSFDYELLNIIKKYLKNELKNNNLNIFYNNNINLSNIIKLFKLFLSNVIINNCNIKKIKKNDNNKKININFYDLNFNIFDKNNNHINYINNDNILISFINKPFIIDVEIKFNYIIITN